MFDIDYKLYKLINKRPEYNICDLAKELKCSTSKIYSSLLRLKKDGLIQMENVSGILKIRSVKWYEFLTLEEIEEFKNMHF